MKRLYAEGEGRKEGRTRTGEQQRGGAVRRPALHNNQGGSAYIRKQIAIQVQLNLMPHRTMQALYKAISIAI